jgi:hypothetical protein
MAKGKSKPRPRPAHVAETEDREDLAIARGAIREFRESGEPSIPLDEVERRISHKSRFRASLSWALDAYAGTLAKLAK